MYVCGECDAVYFHAYVLISYTSTMKMESDYPYETSVHIYESMQHRSKDDNTLSVGKCVYYFSINILMTGNLDIDRCQLYIVMS